MFCFRLKINHYYNPCGHSALKRHCGTVAWITILGTLLCVSLNYLPFNSIVLPTEIQIATELKRIISVPRFSPPSLWRYNYGTNLITTMSLILELMVQMDSCILSCSDNMECTAGKTNFLFVI